MKIDLETINKIIDERDEKHIRFLCENPEYIDREIIYEIVDDIDVEFKKYNSANNEYLKGLEEEYKNLRCLEKNGFNTLVKDIWYRYNLTWIFFYSDFFHSKKSNLRTFIFNHKEFNLYLRENLEDYKLSEKQKVIIVSLNWGYKLYSHCIRSKNDYIRLQRLEKLNLKSHDKKFLIDEIGHLTEQCRILNKRIRSLLEENSILIWAYNNKLSASEKYSDELLFDYYKLRLGHKVETAFLKLKEKHPDHEYLNKIKTEKQIYNFNRIYNKRKAIILDKFLY